MNQTIPPRSENETNEFPVSSAYLRIVARMLNLQERELPRLLAGTGLPVDILMPGDETWLTGEQLSQALANGHRLMGNPGFGIALGEQLGPNAHGPIGYLSLASPDLVSSLRSLAEYLPARIGVVELQIELDNEWLTCNYRLLSNPMDYIRQSMCETFALSVQAQVEVILGRKAVEAQIDFSHTAPSYEELYGEYLHGKYSFGEEQVRYRLPAKLAQTPNSVGDSEAYRITLERCRKLLGQKSKVSSTVADRVRSILLSQPQLKINEQEIARALFVSKRTLARRLTQEHTSYRDIRENVLKDLACQALRDSRQSVDSIAESLGYNDSSALRKAFRRWTGQTPRDYREQTRQSTPG